MNTESGHPEETGEIELHPEHIRIAVILFVVFLVFSVLGIQLWNVQINDNTEFNEKAVRQYVRKIRVPAVRGRIFSSDGKTVLAGNRVSYNILFHLSEMRESSRKKTLDHVMDAAEQTAKVIGRANPLKRDAVTNHMNLYPGIPMEVFLDLNVREMGLASELAAEIEGMEVSAVPVRTYPYRSLAAHLLGYVGVSDPQTQPDRAEFFYYLPDLAGRSGLELKFDAMLRGAPGKKLVMVTHRGFVYKELEAPVPAQNGHDLVLTLDLKAQSIAEQLLNGKRGAIIVMDASSGAVLAMASAPTYDLSSFIPKISASDYRALLNDPGKPFTNRAIMGAYMPGSIIKPLDALAFLENGIPSSHEVNCNGVTHIGRNVDINCAAIHGHGPLDLESAIMKSCNDYFIETSLQVGIDKLSAMHRSAGIGQKTGFELNERTGLLPDRNAPGIRWTEAETAYVAIGQGRIEVTPLQAICYISAIANGGTRWRPHIVEKVVDSAGNVVFQARPEQNGRLAASKLSIDIVSSGMYRAVNQPGGSASQARNDKIELHGKTGTAEVGPRHNRHKNTWFTAFGVEPKSQRIYSIIVLVEHGSSGGGTCAPLAKEFFERWLP